MIVIYSEKLSEIHSWEVSLNFVVVSFPARNITNMKKIYREFILLKRRIDN